MSVETISSSVVCDSNGALSLEEIFYFEVEVLI